MKKSAIALWMSAFFLAEGFVGCFSAYSDVEIEGKLQYYLDQKPLDIVTSSDGSKLFVLVEGRILIYSIAENKVIDSISVEKDLDRLALTWKGNALILSSNAGKRVEIIRFQLLQKIDVSGLPFKGPEHAPVTVAVFSDYQ